MSAVAPDETLDPLVGNWDVVQLARGHRGSTDDRLTAWRAISVRPEATDLLDLGAGVGTVGLTALWHLPNASLVAIEAQEVSHRLFRRTVEHNGLQHRVQAIHGDIRDPSVLPEGRRFGLVTGSPPYTPVGSGTISPHPQKAHCRMEIRGGLEVYCEAARRWMAPGGRFVFVMLANDERTERFPVEAGLAIVERTDVTFREEQGPFIAVVVCAHAEEAVPRVTHQLTVRGPDNEWTEPYTRVMHGLRDFPPERRP
ncbi:MAG: methyltransferase [Myxococcota bacterium]